MDVTPNDVKIAIGDKMPATCDELRRRLARLGITTTVDGKEFKER